MEDPSAEELSELLLAGPRVLLGDLLGGFDPMDVAGSVALAALSALYGADLLANAVPGIDAQLIGALGVARLGDHATADPAQLGVAPVDAQAFLVGVALVYRDDPGPWLLAVVRVEVGNWLSLMVFIIGAFNAHGCTRLTVKRRGQCRVFRMSAAKSRGTKPRKTCTRGNCHGGWWTRSAPRAASSW